MSRLNDPLRDFSTDPRVFFLSGLALIIGTASAVVACVLLWLIAVITNLAFFGRFSSSPAIPGQNHLGVWVIFIPAMGGLVIGFMARYGSEKIRGHGIPEALEAILLGRSKVEAKVAVLKPLSSAISIGTGGPFGAEGPIIMTGGALGSLLAQYFHVSSSERKALLVAGAAGGMSAIFGTPVAAVLLAVELLLFEWKPRSLIPVAVASITAYGWRVPLLGVGPVFSVVPHAALGYDGLTFACLVGLIVGIASGILTKMVYGFEDLFPPLKLHWMWWPVIGGLFVGIGGYLDPRVLGVGYGTIHSLLNGEILGIAALSLLVGKALVWSVSLGSGTSGGVLAPLLMIGGALGALMGQFIPVGTPGQWAMVGLAAMMGGTMRAPLTAVIFTLELTYDIKTLPALLIASVASHLVAVLWLKRSILTEKIARRGHHISCEYATDPFELHRISEIMGPDIPAIGTATGVTVASNELVRAAVIKLLRHDLEALPVVDPDHPTHCIGTLTRSTVMTAHLRWYEEEHHRETYLNLKNK